MKFHVTFHILHVKMQQKVFTRSNASILILDFMVSVGVRNKFLFFVIYPVRGILLYQHTRTGTHIMVTLPLVKS
jgi:hypothetical protein